MPSRRAAVLVALVLSAACTKFTTDDDGGGSGDPDAGFGDGGMDAGADAPPDGALDDHLVPPDAPLDAAPIVCPTPLHSDDFEGEISQTWSFITRSADVQMMADNRRSVTGTGSLFVGFASASNGTNAELGYTKPVVAKRICMEGSVYVESDGKGEVDLFAFSNVDGSGTDKTIGLVRSAASGFVIEYADATNTTRESGVTFPLAKWVRVKLAIDVDRHLLQSSVGNDVLPTVSIPSTWPTANVASKVGAFYVGKPGTAIGPTGPWAVSFDDVRIYRD